MEVLVSTTKLILVLRILYLYYEVYPGRTKLILVLRSLFLSFGYRSTRRYYRTDSLYRGTRRYYRTYTNSCISDLILVFRILYSDLIRVLRNLYLSYGTYTCLIELIRVLRILFLCEGTRRYDELEQIRIISHTRSY